MLRIIRNDLGRKVEVKIDADVSLGTLCRRADIVGIPVDHALNGATVTFIQEGIVALTVSPYVASLGAGSYLYWDVSSGALSIGAGAGDVEVGQVIGSDPDGGTKVYLVRLRVGFPRASAGNDQSTCGE